MSLEIYNDTSGSALFKNTVTLGELNTLYIRNTGVSSKRLMRVRVIKTDTDFGISLLGPDSKVLVLLPNKEITPGSSLPLYIESSSNSGIRIASKGVVNLLLEYI